MQGVLLRDSRAAEGKAFGMLGFFILDKLIIEKDFTSLV
jgi:hypothetical protein